MSVKPTEFESQKIKETFPGADIVEVYGQSEHHFAVKRQKQIAGRNYHGVASLWGEHRQLYLVIRP